MREYRYYVYLMASETGTLYVGVTGDIEGRTEQHKKGQIEGFTQKYRCHKLVYFEEFEDIEQAILREKQIKSWSRYKKEALIRSTNPGWQDLSLGWQRKEIPRAVRARNDKDAR